MRDRLPGVIPILQLTRVTSALAAVANVWFVILWTRATPQERGRHALTTPPDWLPATFFEPYLLTGGAMVGVGLFVFGAALNDALDLRRDRTLHPDRPLPSGQVGVDAAVSIVAASLIVGLLGAWMLGPTAVLVSLFTACSLLFYNMTARFVPSVGIVFLGLLYAAHMTIPNVRLVFLWPIWLVMTHALAVAALAHVIAHKRPKLSHRATAAAIAGWVFWSLVLLAIAWRRGGESGLWPEWISPAAAVGPALLAGLFMLVAYRKARHSRSSERAAERLTRYGTLWIVLYDAAWMWGAGATRGAIILSVLALIGFVGMMALREMQSLLETPPGYRR